MKSNQDIDHTTAYHGIRASYISKFYIAHTTAYYDRYNSDNLKITDFRYVWNSL